VRLRKKGDLGRKARGGQSPRNQRYPSMIAPTNRWTTKNKGWVVTVPPKDNSPKGSASRKAGVRSHSEKGVLTDVARKKPRKTNRIIRQQTRRRKNIPSGSQKKKRYPRIGGGKKKRVHHKKHQNLGQKRDGRQNVGLAGL